MRTHSNSILVVLIKLDTHSTLKGPGVQGVEKCDNKRILGHPELSQESHEPLKTKRVLLLYDRFRERMQQKMSEPKAMQFYSSHT